jgi:hypothetical protein
MGSFTPDPVQRCVGVEAGFPGGVKCLRSRSRDEGCGSTAERTAKSRAREY